VPCAIVLSRLNPQKNAGVDSRNRLQCLIVWPRDAFNLPVDENAGYCVMLVVFLQDPLELSAIGHFIKLLYLNRYCILLQHSQGLHAGPYHTQRKEKKSLRFSAIITGASWGGSPELILEDAFKK